ncbi:MAG: hypothetical protein ABIZ71_07240, partial [Gemmatimonadales bacterium]
MDVEAHQVEQLLQDQLAGREGLGRRFCSLQLSTLDGNRAAQGGEFGDLSGGELVAPARGGRVMTWWATAIPAWSVIASGPIGAILPARTILRARTILPDRTVVPARTILTGWSFLAGGRRIGRTIVSAWCAVAIAIERGSGAAILSGQRGCRQRPGGSGVPLGGRPSEFGARSGENSGGLGAHPEDPTAAGGQDLEIEILEARPECLA